MSDSWSASHVLQFDGRSPMGRDGMAGDGLARCRPTRKRLHRRSPAKGSGGKSSSWSTNPIFI